MAEMGKIRAKFKTMWDAFPKYDHLPPLVKEYYADLKRQDARNTPCCLQMSYALNATGQKIYPHSQRRPNAFLGGNYYIHAVDELELYLIGRYGRTEDVKIDPAGKARNIAQIKEYLATKKGLFVFRGGHGHTELWDGEGIKQRMGAPDPSGATEFMNEDGIFSNPRIVFWEVTEEADPSPVPAWLPGWWSVYDGNQYYYYFTDQHGVTYTKVAPTLLSAPPARSPLNEGTVTMTEHGLVIDWNPADGGATKETFTRMGWTSESEMNGVSNRYAPLFARKMT